MKRILLAALAGILLVACSQGPNPTPSPTPGSTSSPTASPTGSCQPTDQDQYIYNPGRLAVQAGCIRITGEVLAKIQEADGDFHIRVLLDSQYQNLLYAANQQQCANNDQGVRVCGLLVVEPVCVNPVTQSDAIQICASDPDPLVLLPNVGQHVWMEGRYVLDAIHGWTELHPLYRWAVA